MNELENALRLFPSKIHFHCGHYIEATVADIENLDDGVDLSLCPACKKAEAIQEAMEIKRGRELKEELSNSW